MSVEGFRRICVEVYGAGGSNDQNEGFVVLGLGVKGHPYELSR